jgi:hypothetical protein
MEANRRLLGWIIVGWFNCCKSRGRVQLIRIKLQTTLQKVNSHGYFAAKSKELSWVNTPLLLVSVLFGASGIQARVQLFQLSVFDVCDGKLIYHNISEIDLIPEGGLQLSGHVRLITRQI